MGTGEGPLFALPAGETEESPANADEKAAEEDEE
jgi:hypothetical protein